MGVFIHGFFFPNSHFISGKMMIDIDRQFFSFGVPFFSEPQCLAPKILGCHGLHPTLGGSGFRLSTPSNGWHNDIKDR